MVKQVDYAIYMDDSEFLLKTVRDFCAEHGIAESTFGRLAVNDGKFVGRIANGSRVEMETAKRVANFMDRLSRGKIRVIGRPKRKKDIASKERMEELINTETSIRTSGSFAFHEQRQRFHVFANTTNESWQLADRIAHDLEKMPDDIKSIRIFYAPMDNGITLTRSLRALHARFPHVPVMVVLKGRGLEDLRNTMGRLVDRLVEHPNCVFVLTNLYLWEALKLQKTSNDNPHPISWRDVALDGSKSFDFQNQIATLYQELNQEWRISQGEEGQPVYACPSVITVYREDQRASVESLVPRQGQTDELAYDYCMLNHPYLHTHTMKFKTDYVLSPVCQSLAPGGRAVVVQAYGQDPAHEIVKKLWPDQPLERESRYDIIKQLRHVMGADQKQYSFSGLTDKKSLFRFDMHTLPVFEGENIGSMSLASAWNNAVYFTQVKEELAQASFRDDNRALEITESVLRHYGGLWFVNETFSITRKRQSLNNAPNSKA